MVPPSLWVKESGGCLVPEAHTFPSPGHSQTHQEMRLQKRGCASSWPQSAAVAVGGG